MKTRDQKQKRATPARPAPVSSSSHARWIHVGLVAAVGAVGTWALFVYVVWAQIPSALVGKWVVIDGPQEGATFDFQRDGTMVGRVNIDGMEGIVNAQVRVEDNKIYATSRHPQTGSEATRVQTIRLLTPRELIVEDEQHQVLRMERAR